MNQYVRIRIDNADVHHLGMQVDTTVMLVRFGVKLHETFSSSEFGVHNYKF